MLRTSGDGPSSKYLAANATWTTLFEVNKTSGGGKACSFSYEFGEFGLYELAINGTGCAVNVAKEPARTNLTIFYAFLILVGVKIAWEAGQKVYNSRKCRLIFVRIMRSFSGRILLCRVQSGWNFVDELINHAVISLDYTCDRCMCHLCNVRHLCRGKTCQVLHQRISGVVPGQVSHALHRLAKWTKWLRIDRALLLCRTYSCH